MGEFKKYKCNKCGNIIQLTEGVGELWNAIGKDMFYPPKQNSNLNFYYKLDKNIILEAQKFIENRETTVNEASYQPYICKKCGNIESKLYFEITDTKTKETHHPEYLCKCGNKYEKLTEQERIYCNKCGCEMKIYQTDLWD